MQANHLSILGLIVDGETIDSIGFVLTGRRIDVSTEITIPHFGLVKVKVDTHLGESIEIDQTGVLITKVELQNFAKEMERTGWRHIGNSRSGNGPSEPLI
jgi:hypothetical protein